VNAERVTGLEGWPDTRKGHPVPDLVAEIDRSVDSSHKLAPYFRMGVREAWTWSRRDGVHIWVADTASPRQFRESSRSRVLPGLRRDDLDALLAPCPHPRRRAVPGDSPPWSRAPCLRSGPAAESDTQVRGTMTQRSPRR